LPVTATAPLRRPPVRRRPRQTQAERVDAMRARLLDATIELLAKKGYARLSTNDVVRRARVSRGALAHHFPTKAALMRAAAERLIDERTAEFEATFLALSPADRTMDYAIDLMWDYFQGPTFATIIELAVAARTNPDLRRVLADAPERIGESIFGAFVALFPAAAANPAARPALRAAIALMAGMALQSTLDSDRLGHHAELLGWVKFTGAALELAPVV
jgi:AcrR family transcriptional regulator